MRHYKTNLCLDQNESFDSILKFTKHLNSISLPKDSIEKVLQKPDESGETAVTQVIYLKCYSTCDLILLATEKEDKVIQ